MIYALCQSLKCSTLTEARSRRNLDSARVVMHIIITPLNNILFKTLFEDLQILNTVSKSVCNQHKNVSPRHQLYTMTRKTEYEGDVAIPIRSRWMGRWWVGINNSTSITPERSKSEEVAVRRCSTYWMQREILRCEYEAKYISIYLKPSMQVFVAISTDSNGQ